MDSRPARPRLTAEAPRAKSRARASGDPTSLRVLRTVGAPTDDARNLLVHGDNLPALHALAARFAGTIRCAYLDPPFNTGRAFAEYADARASDAWLAMMRPRLEATAALLADDGAIVVEIDDNELGPLTVLLDAIFGAKNRVSTITVVRSAPTGHKAINPAPVNVSDFVLVYAKDKKRWRYRPQVHVRDRYDKAYATWLDDPDAPPTRWTFRPLRGVVAKAHGFATSRAAVDAVGKAELDRRTHAFAVANARHVVRFAQPRFEAIAKAAQRVVERSRAAPRRVFVHERPGRAPFIVHGGNRILFLADKVRVVDGARVLVEPLTNVWRDVPFQGIAREGGVVFSRNKKPEKLLARLLALATDEGDWVLDPFLGSGTTAAVAHKMGRRWIGIEDGDHGKTLAEPRLRRVVQGEDATGVTSAFGFTGGGGFDVCALA